MTDAVNLIVKLSSEAYELYLEGKADFSSGGIRDSKGRMLEMYKPVCMTNIYQKPADFLMNKKMTSLLTQSKKMERSIEEAGKLLKSVNVGVNAAVAVGVLNCAITAVGFAVISKQISSVSSKLDKLASQMKEYRLEDKSMEIKEIILDLKSVGDILRNRRLNENDILNIEKLLNKTQVLLEWLTGQFEKSETDVSGYLFELLYNLSFINAEILKEYGAQYYYKYNQYPSNYDRWADVLKYVTKKKVYDVLKRTVWLMNPTALPNDITNAVNVTLNTINLQRQDLLEYKKIVPILPMEAHYDMAKYIENQLENGNYVIDDNAEVAFVFE